MGGTCARKGDVIFSSLPTPTPESERRRSCRRSPWPGAPHHPMQRAGEPWMRTGRGCTRYGCQCACLTFLTYACVDLCPRFLSAKQTLEAGLYVQSNAALLHYELRLHPLRLHLRTDIKLSSSPVRYSPFSSRLTANIYYVFQRYPSRPLYLPTYSYDIISCGTLNHHALDRPYVRRAP